MVSGQFLRKVRSTCRRGPHLCPCSPKLPRDRLVERTTGVGGPSYLLSMSTRQCYFHGNRYNTLYIELHIIKNIMQSLNQEMINDKVQETDNPMYSDLSSSVVNVESSDLHLKVVLR